MNKAWFLYIIQCKKGTLYTGITTDVERRFDEHRKGIGAKYLRGRGPLKVVFKRRVGDRGEALRLERKVKKLDTHRKRQLLENPEAAEKVFSES